MAMTLRLPRAPLTIIVSLGIFLLFAGNVYLKIDDKRGVSQQDDRMGEINMLLRQLSDKFEEKLNRSSLLDAAENTHATNTDDTRAISSVNIAVAPTKLMPLKDSINTPRPMRTLSPNDSQGFPPVLNVKNKLAYMQDPFYRPSKCPKTISTITRYSSWFRNRFKPHVKMFLDEHDIYDESNYKKLANYVMPFGFNRVNKTVLGEIMNNANFTNPLVNRPTHQCIRCAVVGGGGILNGSNAGEQIDSHDYVFRLNLAHTSKFAHDVGRKTSFYEFYPESQNVWTVEDRDAAFLFTNFKQSDLFYAERMLRQQQINSKEYVMNGKNVTFFRPPRIDVGRVKITHPDFVRYIFTEFLELKAFRPTTGALVVFTAIHICDEVTIYGFGYDQKFTMHYFDSEFKSHSNESTASHDVNNERDLWNKLHSEGVIKLFKRDS